MEKPNKVKCFNMPGIILYTICRWLSFNPAAGKRAIWMRVISELWPKQTDNENVKYSVRQGRQRPGSGFSSEYEFIAMHWDEDSNVRPHLSLLNIQGGELNFTHLTDVYPFASHISLSSFGGWKQSYHQTNGIVGFTLHQELSDAITDFYGDEKPVWTGAWMDLRDGEDHEAPALNQVYMRCRL